jgi:hypothetical protein
LRLAPVAKANDKFPEGMATESTIRLAWTVVNVRRDLAFQPLTATAKAMGIEAPAGRRRAWTAG